MKRISNFVFLSLALTVFILFTIVQPVASATTKTGLDLSARQIQTSQEIPTDQIIIKFKDPGASQAAIIPSQTDVVERLNAAAGTTLQYKREMSGGASVYKLSGRTSIDEVNKITAQLMALPEVEYAEADLIMQPMTTTPNDPQYANQWHYKAPTAGNYGINMPAAWDITKGASNVVIADIDTGITDHPDLLGRTVPGYDFITDVNIANDGNARDADPHDPGDWITPVESSSGFFAGCLVENSSWHGTHTAGTIGAASNNNYGVAGVNWVSKILPVRVLGKCGGFTSDIVDGMRWAAGIHVTGVPDNPNPAKVLSMSLGGTVSGGCASTPTYQSAVSDIIATGATVVVAAGNANSDFGNTVPATCTGVISVAATDRTGSRAYYSNFGATVSISAPGGAQSSSNDPNGVLSTLNTGTTVPVTGTLAYYQGTSMATPHVTGVVSLLYSLNPSITSAQVLQVLQNTITPFPGGSTCSTSLCGPGILNAGNAVLPRLTALVPGGAQKGSGTMNLKVNGFNFNHNSKVEWNGTPLTTTVTSSMVLSATIPAADLNTSGTYSVTVSTNFASIGTYVTPVLHFNVFDRNVFLPLLSKPAPPPPPVLIVNGDFESGTTGWTQFSTHGYTLITTGLPVSLVPHSGIYAVWLGGDVSEISYIQQQITVNVSFPYLAYWHWIASQKTTCGGDIGGVTVNGGWFDTYNLCVTTSTGGWVKHVVNLSAYVGQTITIQIRAETNSNVSQNSNLFVDDVSLQSTPTLAETGIPISNLEEGIYSTKPEYLLAR